MVTLSGTVDFRDNVLFHDGIDLDTTDATDLTLENNFSTLGPWDATYDYWHESTVDAGSLGLLDVDGSPADQGHLGGPDANAAFFEMDADGDGSISPLDCDDADPTVGTGIPETCDGIDNNCNGLVDDADPTLQRWYEDLDGDGLGGGDGEATCTPAAGWIAVGGDCDDTDPTVFTGAPEACVNDVDNDCDGLVDAEDPDFTPDPLVAYADVDQDGHGDPAAPLDICSDDWVPGLIFTDDDCNDTNADVAPGLEEVCDGLDNDCNVLVDDDLQLYAYFLDEDGDGEGAPDSLLASCGPVDGYVLGEGDDCDDTDPNTYPGAPELCDLQDNDCDDEIDEGATMPLWFTDADGDGVGSTRIEQACFAPEGGVLESGDCDDSDPTIFPDAEDDPSDGIDSNCDGEPEGCGCTATPGSYSPSLALLIGLVAALRRRRE